jgi:2-oxoisovalerate dehydrogenase E1 component alpha subunit
VSVPNVADRAPGYGIPGVIVDGTDVLACYVAGREAVERARSGGGPTLIEAKVTRLTAHSSDDQQTKYRSESDLAEGRAHDPLPIFRERLRGAGVLTDALEAELATEISALVEDATDHAEAEADADPWGAMDWVYADAAAGEPPPPWHPTGPAADEDAH